MWTQIRKQYPPLELCHKGEDNFGLACYYFEAYLNVSSSSKRIWFYSSYPRSALSLSLAGKLSELQSVGFSDSKGFLASMLCSHYCIGGWPESANNHFSSLYSNVIGQIHLNLYQSNSAYANGSLRPFPGYFLDKFKWFWVVCWGSALVQLLIVSVRFSDLLRRVYCVWVLWSCQPLFVY